MVQILSIFRQRSDCSLADLRECVVNLAPRTTLSRVVSNSSAFMADKPRMARYADCGSADIARRRRRGGRVQNPFLPWSLAVSMHGLREAFLFASALPRRNDDMTQARSGTASQRSTPNHGQKRRVVPTRCVQWLRLSSKPIHTNGSIRSYLH